MALKGIKLIEKHNPEIAEELKTEWRKVQKALHSKDVFAKERAKHDLSCLDCKTSNYYHKYRELEI